MTKQEALAQEMHYMVRKCNVLVQTIGFYKAVIDKSEPNERFIPKAFFEAIEELAQPMYGELSLLDLRATLLPYDSVHEANNE